MTLPKAYKRFPIRTWYPRRRRMGITGMKTI
jgi:hypothetical protein